LSDTDKPHFRLELYLSRTATRVDVDDPTLIDEGRIKQAWDMMSEFIMDMIDDLGIGEEITDERFRELFIEVCYRLIYREMCTLQLLPIWERNFKDRLAKGKRIQRLPRRKGDE